LADMNQFPEIAKKGVYQCQLCHSNRYNHRGTRTGAL
jgi:hypothetical protein